MYVDSSHPYYPEFRQAQLDLDISTIDTHMQPIVQLLRDHSDIVTRYCCEGHEAGEEAYLMMVGGRDTLEFLTKVIVDLEDYANPDLEGFIVYTLELNMMFQSDTLPKYLAYVFRIAGGLPEVYKLEALQNLTTLLRHRLGNGLLGHSSL